MEGGALVSEHYRPLASYNLAFNDMFGALDAIHIYGVDVNPFTISVVFLSGGSR